MTKFKTPRLILFVWLAFVSCQNTEKCFSTGEEVNREITLPEFNQIEVGKGIKLILKQADTQKVEIQTGELLLDGITAEVNNNTLKVADNNSCNISRPYGSTTITITSPQIQEIRNATQYWVKSDGVLNYDSLQLISENYNRPDALAVGDFYLNLDVNELSILSNNLSSFYLSGTVDNFNINLSDGDGRIEAEDLTAKQIEVYHRGSNDIILTPTEQIEGTILGTGNVILKNTPPLVNVEVLYTGQLILEEE